MAGRQSAQATIPASAQRWTDLRPLPENNAEMHSLEPRSATAHSTEAISPANGELPAFRLQGRSLLTAQVRLECEAMAKYAIQHALETPPELIAQLISALESFDRDALNEATPWTDAQAYAWLHQLTMIHQRLAQAIAPATPQGVAVLDQGQQNTRFAWLGPVPLIRVLTLLSIGFLISLVVSAIPASISAENMARGVLSYSGLELLLNTLFLLNCAGLGASFAMLFHAHRYVSNATYDPRYNASYAARLVLGLIAGLMLVELLPEQPARDGVIGAFNKPVLAMLGGFSASAVQRVLQRFVEAIETVVGNDRSARTQAMLHAGRAHTATERLQQHSELVAKLLTLQQSLNSGSTAENVRQQLGDLTKALLMSESNRSSDDP